MDGCWCRIWALHDLLAISVCAREAKRMRRDWKTLNGTKECLCQTVFSASLQETSTWIMWTSQFTISLPLSVLFIMKKLIFLRCWRLCHWHKILWLASSLPQPDKGSQLPSNFTHSSLTEALRVVRSERDVAGQLSDDVGVAHELGEHIVVPHHVRIHVNVALGYHAALAAAPPGWAEQATEQGPPEEDVDPGVQDGVDGGYPDGSQVCVSVVFHHQAVGKDLDLRDK